MLKKRLSLIISVFAVFLLLSCTSKHPSKDSLVPHNIACIGDSITYGFKLADPESSSYPAKLSRRAKNQWRVLNLGVNGATVSSKGDIPYVVQSQYDSLQNTSADIVVVMLGTNDLKNDNWRFKDNFVSEYVALINGIRKISTNPKIIVCSIPPVLVNLPIGITQNRQAKVNTLIKKAAEVGGASFLDISSAYSAQSSFFIDGVHPNSRGTSLLADIVYNYIVSM